MFKKLKGLLSLVICISLLCTVMPITGFAAESNAASVTFNGSTEYYATVDAAWAAAVSFDTTAENKATVKLLDNCTAENTLTNTEGYLVLDTNGKTLTTPNAIAHTNDVLCGIGAEGGSLEIIGNGTISGLSAADFGRAILLITGGEVYADGVTIHNTGTSGSNSVRVNGGSFYFLDGYLHADGEYALRADSGNVYLYSGKVESTGRLAAAINDMLLDVQICYSDKPLYFIDNDTDNWALISSMSKVHLADNLIMDLEYSDNPDGSNSKILKNVTAIDTAANTEKNYLKIQTYKTSCLFGTKYGSTLLSKIKSAGVTDLTEDAFTAVHFVDLADYDLTDVTYSDYSANGDGSVKAWVSGSELYIGGNGKIIAGNSLAYAFANGKKIDRITGLDRLYTSNVTDMEYMFYNCGRESTVFTLDLGDGFDTSNVTNMDNMFCCCGKDSTVFTLNLGDHFDTSKVTDMGWMFYYCGSSSPAFMPDLGDKFDTSYVTDMYQMFVRFGYSSTVFTTFDLSGFTVNPSTNLDGFARDIPATKLIFGKGWRYATLPAQYHHLAQCSVITPTEIVGATKNLLNYDWTKEKRTVTFTDNAAYTITAAAEDGGTVSGGGTVLDGESITLTASANEGYTFEGWYDGDAKVCETEEFVIEDADGDKTYTAKFTEKTAVVSKLFNTEYYGTLLNKIKFDSVTDVKEDEITGVHFVDLADYDLTSVTYSDYSASGDESVKAWMDGTELYIGGYGKIIAGSSLVYAFRTGEKINSITGFEMLDTSNVTDMSQMFQSCGNHSTEFTLDLGNNFNTSNVIRMKDMFYGCGRESTKFTLNLGDNFDTSNVYDMSGLFHNCGYNSTVLALDLGEKFDTSNVINMSDMFNGCGAKSTVFTLDLGEKFDTSNVTNMKSMFRECGYSSTKFTISLGDKFDTSKVTDMSNMFYRFGDESEEFTLDLGDHFDTSNVENMTYMFYACGYRSPVFKLNFGNKFNTSKVTDMSSMFAYTGCYSKEFNLALDDRFDTSNVTSISAMFLGCGSESETFTLDLGNHFDTSKVIGSMALMFQGCGEASKVFTLDLGDKFDTSNVINMDNMFYRCGFKSNVFTLDLGDKFNTSKVTDMGRMFGYCGFNSTAFTTLDLSSFTIGAKTDLRSFATYSPVTEFIFGEGWANASLPTKNAFYSYDKVDTTVTGATKNLLNYNWTNDRRTVTFPDKNYYTITALADDGGTVTGGGTIVESSSITLTAAANDGYTFAGWYDGGTKVCDTAEFTVENVTEDKTYTAKFAKNAVSYTITALADDGGTVSGGGTVAEGSSITLTATAKDGYTFAGWYDGNTKVCDTAEFTLSNITADKTYTAKFTKNTVYYTITAEAGTEGGTVSGGGEVTEGGSITLTATANDGYTFDGWYDGDTKVCDTAEFVVSNVTEDKTYTAKFTKNQVVGPDPEPSEFDFTTIRTLRAKDIVVNHSDKTITMSADGNVKNIAIYQDQKTVIPDGTIKLADAKDATIKQNSGSFYIMNNAGSAVVTVDITVGGVTKQYTLSVNFNDFVEKNLRMYQRKIGSTQKDIVYGTDVGYVAGNEIHITPDAGVEYIGLTKYQGTPGNYNGIITPVKSYPTYSTFEESTSSNEPVFIDWQGCIFVKRPTDGSKSVELEVNYTLGTETSVYKVIVDFSEESEFAFSAIRSERAKNIVIDHEGKTITMDSDGRVSNIAVYKYQLGSQSNMQITLADKLSADVTQNDGSFYIKDSGSGTASVLVDITIGNTTKQYTLTVNFADAFDFTDIRSLRAKNTTVDHENRTITVDSDGIVSNIAVYKAQSDIIKGGSITLADMLNASVQQNAGSFYIKDDGSGSASVLVDITIGKMTKQYTLTVNFSDGFDFDTIRTLRASDISVDHNAQKITVLAASGAKNVALYMSQTGIINGGRLILKDEKDSLVQKNSGSYYIMKQDGVSESTVSADITVGGKTKTYEITVCFAD